MLPHRLRVLLRLLPAAVTCATLASLAAARLDPGVTLARALTATLSVEARAPVPPVTLGLRN